jgi:prepilin-type N-terminal cleavage/methylation domain-containing protein
MKTPLQNGFSLIEILVVVAILAILVALAVPAVGRAVDRAGTADDIHKLKQIGAGMSAFAADNSGRLPNNDLRLPPPIPDTEAYVWAEAVDRYFEPIPDFWNRTSYNWVKRPNSPFFSSACDPYPGFSTPPQYPLWKRPIAFGYNKYINDDTHWDGHIVRIPQPSKTVIVAEVNGINTLPMSPDQPAATKSNVQASYRISRSGNTGLYLFADYHVETLQGDRSMGYYSANPQETNIWRWW